MHDVEQRLTKCFSAVFPELSPEEILKASPNTTGAWDSLTAVTLMALVEEEFRIALEPTDVESFESFEEILKRVNEAIRRGPIGSSLDYGTLA